MAETITMSWREWAAEWMVRAYHSGSRDACAEVLKRARRMGLREVARETRADMRAMAVLAGK